jgi:hypothetical protein
MMGLLERGAKGLAVKGRREEEEDDDDDDDGRRPRRDRGLVLVQRKPRLVFVLVIGTERTV